MVDESTLTGESVPQIKTSLTSEPIDFEEDLDMTGVRWASLLLHFVTSWCSTVLRSCCGGLFYVRSCCACLALLSRQLSLKVR